MAERGALTAACAGAATLALLCILAYLPGLAAVWVLDDYQVLHPFLDAARSARPSVPWLFDAGPLGRPLAGLSFRLDAWLHGADIAGWKRTNLALHLLNGATLAWLVARLAAGSAPAAAPHWRLAALVSGLWLLHPLHVSTVLYTVQRMTLMSAFFTLLGLAAYLEARYRSKVHARGARACLLVFLASLPCAALSKETGLILPAFVVLAELLPASGADCAARRRGRHMAVLLGAPLILLAIAGLVWAWPAIEAGYAMRPYSMWERVLSQPRVLWEYLGMTLVPWPAHMAFLHDAYAYSTGWLTPRTTLPALLGLLALGGGILWLRRRLPLAAFGIGFFLLGHALEASVVPLELMFEHRHYLPSAGVFVAAAAVVRPGLPVWLVPRQVGLLTIAAFLVLGALTHARAGGWATEEGILRVAEAARPESIRLASVQANRLHASSGLDAALGRLAQLDGLGVALQRMRMRCAEGEPLAAEEFERLPIAARRAPDPYVQMEATRLLDLAGDGRCRVDREGFRRVLERMRNVTPAALARSHRFLDGAIEAAAYLPDP